MADAEEDAQAGRVHESEDVLEIFHIPGLVLGGQRVKALWCAEDLHIGGIAGHVRGSLIGRRVEEPHALSPARVIAWQFLFLPRRAVH